VKGHTTTKMAFLVSKGCGNGEVEEDGSKCRRWWYSRCAFRTGDSLKEQVEMEEAWFLEAPLDCVGCPAREPCLAAAVSTSYQISHAITPLTEPAGTTAPLLSTVRTCLTNSSINTPSIVTLTLIESALFTLKGLTLPAFKQPPFPGKLSHHTTRSSYFADKLDFPKPIAQQIGYSKRSLDAPHPLANASTIGHTDDT
jgi:hypothetical protein